MNHEDEREPCYMLLNFDDGPLARARWVKGEKGIDIIFFLCYLLNAEEKYEIYLRFLQI